jgi:rod shape-determining protein MreB
VKAVNGSPLLGIDLGTSRTRVITDSGARDMVRSVVGYPKDIIAIKLLGESVVVGEKAYGNPSYLDYCYPLSDGVLKELTDRDVDVARELIAHAIHRVLPKSSAGISGIVGVPARASTANKEMLLGILQEFMATALVVSEPFLVGYALDKLLNTIVIDIGAGTIDLCALKGTMPGPQDQATIPGAGNLIDERLRALIADRYPAVHIDSYIACQIKEAYGFVGDPAEEITVELRADAKPILHDVAELIGIACESIVPQIVEKTTGLLKTFAPEVQGEVLGNILISGGGSRINGLDTLIAAHLGDYGEVSVTCVQDPDWLGCAGALKLAQELPTEHWDQLGDIVAR